MPFLCLKKSIFFKKIWKKIILIDRDVTIEAFILNVYNPFYDQNPYLRIQISTWFP